MHIIYMICLRTSLSVVPINSFCLCTQKCAKLLLFSEICKKMDDNRSRKWILQGKSKGNADTCRQLADVIRRRETEKREGECRQLDGGIRRRDPARAGGCRQLDDVIRRRESGRRDAVNYTAEYEEEEQKGRTVS